MLRNASAYLRHVMDYGSDEDIAYTLRDVNERRWLAALRSARPGNLSCGSYVLFGAYFGLVGDADIYRWPRNAHMKDIKPLADDTREATYRRHARPNAPSRETPTAEPAP